MRYAILKDFKGSQTGSTAEDFIAGTEAELSDYLVSCVDPAWIRRLDVAEPEHAPEAAVTSAPTAAPRCKKPAAQPKE
jgi:hypothetical protein